MIIVSSWDELLDAGVDCVLDKISADELKIKKDLVFQVRVCGASWDGSIDYRGANYVIELQKAVNRIYQELYGEDILLRNLNKIITVKVKVVKGSSFFEINANEALIQFLGKAVGQMSGGQITLVFILGILSVGGYLTVRKILDYKAKVQLDAQQKKHTAEIVTKLTTTIDRALDVIERKDLEAPNRKLVNKLGEHDSITFPNDNELTAPIAKQRYPRKPKLRTEAGIFDETYTIESIDFNKKPPIFIISVDGLSFPASAEFAGPDIEQLSSDLEKTMKSGDDFTVPLHVFVTYNKRSIKTASIQGTGTARDKSGKIDDLIRYLE